MQQDVLGIIQSDRGMSSIGSATTRVPSDGFEAFWSDRAVRAGSPLFQNEILRSTAATTIAINQSRLKRREREREQVASSREVAHRVLLRYA